MADPSIGLPLASRSGGPPTANGAPGSSHEARLQARIAQLEAALADAARCLEDAERRAAEQLATQARLTGLEQKLAVIVSSKSWRLTTPLRTGVGRARSSFRR